MFTMRIKANVKIFFHTMDVISTFLDVIFAWVKLNLHQIKCATVKHGRGDVKGGWICIGLEGAGCKYVVTQILLY